MNPTTRREPGAIWLHRAIRSSAIWSAPPEYLKVWIHILLTVPYVGDNAGIRAYFAARENCPGVSHDQWKRAIAWLRDQGSISITRIRQGVLIKVCHFSRYQRTEGLKQVALSTAPLTAMWQKKTGGPMSGRNSMILERLLSKHGAPAVSTALEHYLDATEARYASIARLEETFGIWLAPPTPKQPQAARGRAALSGHKGTTDYGAIDPTN